VTDPLDLIEQRLLERSSKVRRRGDKITACCPAHSDKNPSLGVARGNERDVVIKCQAGCSADSVMAALSLTWTDFGESTQQRDQEVRYPYHDAHGTVLFTVVRRPGKKFLQMHHDASGNEVWNIRGVTRVLYRLPAVLAAVADGRNIYIVEGEKDVDRLAAVGVAATCNPGGADDGSGSKFTAEMADTLTSARVVVVADKDKPGMLHASHVRRLLLERGCDVTVKQAMIGKDVSDHLAAGKTGADLVVIDPDQLLATWDDEGKDVADSDDGWPEPLPLLSQGEPEPFPIWVMPAWVLEHAKAVADNIQVAIDLPCLLGLGALSVATLGRLQVRYDWQNWTQPCSLFISIGLPPSAGKTPAKSAMFRPLEEYEVERVELARRERKYHGELIDVQENQLATYKKSMTKNVFEERGELHGMVLALEDLRAKMPPSGRLMADDATIEALGMALADAGGAIAVVSAEGGLFDRLAGLYSDGGINLDLYLEGWSGGRYVVDRIKRDSISIPAAHVAVVTTVQPTTIDAIGAKREFVARGLLARFLMAMPSSNVGYRDRRRRQMNGATAEAVYSAELKRVAHAFTHEAVTIRLSDEASEMFADWDEAAEQELQGGGRLEHLSTWVGKLRANVLRLAALLHVGHHRSGDVGTESMAEALTLADYFTKHMLSIAERWGADESIAKARQLLEWMRRHGCREFSLRDIWAPNRRAFPAVEDVIPALVVLVDTNYIRPLFEGPIVAGRGGKPSPRFAVNPAVCRDCGQPDDALRAVRAVRAVRENEKWGIHTSSLSQKEENTDDQPTRTARTARTDPQRDEPPAIPAASPVPSMDHF
jgi:putative DNA primase/helicase